MSQSNITISSTLPYWQREPRERRTLTESDIISIANAWRGRGYENVARAPHGVWVGIAESRLYDTDDDVSIHGPDSTISDDVIRAVVERARTDEWGGELEIRGRAPEEFRERLWLECQRQGVYMGNYGASEDLTRKWEAERLQGLHEEQLLADIKGIATDASLLIAAARGDEEAFGKLNIGLWAFVGSYLDDKQRAELAKMQPIDIVDEIAWWEKVGEEEFQDIEDARDAGFQVSYPRVTPAPTPDHEWRPK